MSEVAKGNTMNTWRHVAILLAALAPAIAIPNTAHSQSAAPRSSAVQGGAASAATSQSVASEAPTGFDDKTNGFEENVRTLRLSTNTLGDGFVECIADSTLVAIRDAQPPDLRGTAVMAPVLEAGDSPRVGRFGWKSQHASLQSFAADAYLNEMGITSPLFPEENTSNGRDVSRYDPVADPDDDGVDVLAFADFMRSTKAPSRGPITPAVRAGESLFNAIGCASCHTPSITTAPPGTPINGGGFVVPDALGNKIIHPYSDYLLHDIGTGDGIPAQPTPEAASTANQMRTAPLWALRTRNRLMHDGLSFTQNDAIARHAGQATGVRQSYEGLAASQKIQIQSFLDSL